MYGILCFQHLQNKAGGYHVHEYPLPYQYDSDTNLCGPEQVGGHWNPLGGATSGVTQDDFEVSLYAPCTLRTPVHS